MREPAYCAGNGFAIPPTYVLGTTDTGTAPEGRSRYGVMSVATDRGLPTASPVDYRSVLEPSSRCGFRRYERV